MYRTNETRKILWDKMEEDEFWPERRAGLEEILRSARYDTLRSMIVEAYIFGYQHAIGISKETSPPSEAAEFGIELTEEQSRKLLAILGFAPQGVDPEWEQFIAEHPEAEA